MALSQKMDEVLQELEDSGTTEGRAIAETLRGIASNARNDEDPEWDMASDTFLLVCAQELRDWAQQVINQFKEGGS